MLYGSYHLFATLLAALAWAGRELLSDNDAQCLLQKSSNVRRQYRELPSNTTSGDDRALELNFDESLAEDDDSAILDEALTDDLNNTNFDEALTDDVNSTIFILDEALTVNITSFDEALTDDVNSTNFTNFHEALTDDVNSTSKINVSYCVYARAFYDDGYLPAFISHYAKLGFHRIIVLKTDGIQYTPDPEHEDLVDIQIVDNFKNAVDQMSLMSKYVSRITDSGCDWCLTIDSDEFLILEDDNISSYVQRVTTQAPSTNVIWFRWGTMERFDDDNLDLGASLQTYKILKSTHIKSMFLVSKLDLVDSFEDPHIARLTVDPVVYSDGQTHNDNNAEFFLNGPAPNVYTDYLLHIQTRSMCNLLTKALLTKIETKKMPKAKALVEYINTMAFDNDHDDNRFKDIVGLKARLSLESSIVHESFDEIEYRGTRHASIISDFHPLGKDFAARLLLPRLGVNMSAFQQMVEKFKNITGCKLRRKFTGCKLNNVTG